MDLSNPLISLCMEGSRAEFDGRLEQATSLYQQAWDSARDDFEACIAAHYLGHALTRAEAEPVLRLHWHQVALERALAVQDARVEPFLPSLYVNLGQALETLGQQVEAEQYYALAAALGLAHVRE